MNSFIEDPEILGNEGWRLKIGDWRLEIEYRSGDMEDGVYSCKLKP